MESIQSLFLFLRVPESVYFDHLKTWKTNITAFFLIHCLETD